MILLSNTVTMKRKKTTIITYSLGWETLLANLGNEESLCLKLLNPDEK